MLKIYCEECGGKKKIIDPVTIEIIDCPTCQGKGYTEVDPFAELKELDGVEFEDGKAAREVEDEE